MMKEELDIIERINILIKQVGGRDFTKKEMDQYNKLIEDLWRVNNNRIGISI